jgi:hypothetical protein
MGHCCLPCLLGFVAVVAVMTERLSIQLWNAQQGHQALMQAWREWIKPRLYPEGRLYMEVKRPTRSTEQNALLWSLLDQIAAQVTWHGQKLTADEWKDMATAALKRQKVVPGIDGGFVVLGSRTSRMTVAEMTELIDFLDAFGAQQGVKFKAAHWEDAA